MADLQKLRDWANLLRSGEFEQTTGRLERDGKYCCLGVASVLAARNGVDAPLTGIDAVDGEVYPHYVPVPEVSRWFDLEILHMTLPFDGGALSPADANDGYGKTFPEIGDAIDQWCDNYEVNRVVAAA